jgi:ABC-2 type transport system permease protein
MSSHVGTGALVRLALRRDRVRLPIWIGTLTLFVIVFAFAIGDLYPTVGSREQLGMAVGANPALVAVLGPLFEPRSIGGLVAWRMSFLALVLVPLMALLAVVRHTRAEEEEGRLELLGSTVMGRRAPLTAALLVACGASLVLGALVALALVAIGEDAVGSIALGVSYTLAGWVFAGVAAITAQVAESSRAASGLAVAVLGAAYLVRGVGDAAGDGGLSWMTWASPLGWVLELRPFAGERWWVAALLVGATAVAVLAAELAVRRRDIDAGLLPPRPGNAEAPPYLSGPVGLAWRLHRASLAAWTLGLFALGAMYGGVAAGVGDLITDTPQIGEILRRVGGEQALIDAFLAATTTIAGLVASGFAIQATLRLRSEETGLRAEHVLATGVSRGAWAMSHVSVAVVGTVVLLVGFGLGLGVTHGARVGDVAGEVPRLVGGAIVQVPAVLVLVGIALALLGLLPRATGVAWGALVAFLVLGQLGGILQLDQWLLDLSPFTHVPTIPGEEVALAPLAALVGVAVAFGIVGLVGLRRRDVG